MAMESIESKSIISGYIELENKALSAFSYIPVVKEHAEVWSPHFATLILESCSQLDSLLRYHIADSEGVKALVRVEGKTDMPMHFENHKAHLAGDRVVCWGGADFDILPYENWQGDGYQPLEWFQVYNLLKHDRIKNTKLATLGNAVNAMAALFIAMVNNPSVRSEFSHFQYIRGGTGSERRWTATVDVHPAMKEEFYVETDLFSYGSCGGTCPMMVLAPASGRFAMRGLNQELITLT